MTLYETILKFDDWKMVGDCAPSGGILPPAASLALADGLRRPAIIHDGGTSRNDDTFGGNDI